MLKSTMEIERAQMRLKLTLPAREARRVREKISSLITIEQEDWTSELEIVSTCTSSKVETIVQLVQSLVCANHTPYLFAQMGTCVLCVHSGVFDGSRMLL